MFTGRVNIDVLLNVLETLVLDESSVTVRLACLGIKVRFSNLSHPAYEEQQERLHSDFLQVMSKTLIMLLIFLL